MEVNKAELKKIADEASATRKNKRRQQQKEARDTASAERRAAEKEAGEILASIPAELKKVAPGARRTADKKGRTVVAKIPVVNERMTSIMQNAGYLDEEDELILRAVRKKFKSFRIAGVELKLKSYTGDRTFGSADGLDEATGPCKYYYIEAKTQID